MSGRGDEEKKDVYILNVPPPYRAMRPVRTTSCFCTPLFSTSCWAVMSPVANRMAVVTLWVSSGREASLAWYLSGVLSASRARPRGCDRRGNRKERYVPAEHLFLSIFWFCGCWRGGSGIACAFRGVEVEVEVRRAVAA